MATSKKSTKTKSAPEKVEIENHEGNGIRGRITLDEDVVATIAGLAARNIEGVYELGKTRFFDIGDDPTRGVNAEVGKKQAAFDVDVVIEYGHDLRKVAGQMRDAIAAEVDKMAGRDTVEININVIDIQLPKTLGEPDHQKEQPRVV